MSLSLFCMKLMVSLYNVIRCFIADNHYMFLHFNGKKSP